MTTRIIVAMLFATSLFAQMPSPITKVVETYCSGCHNGHVEGSGARVATLDPAHIADNRELWSRAERQFARAPCRRSARSARTVVPTTK